MKKLLPLLLLLSLVFSHTACLLPELPTPSLCTTTNNGGGGGGQPELPPYDNDTASYGYYYDQLGGNEKTVYRAIYKNAREATNITFTLESPLVISSPESEGSDAHGNRISSAVRTLVQPAMDALGYDHPEISWIAYGGTSGSSFSISVVTATEGGQLITSIEALTFVMCLETPMESKADVLAFETEMNGAVAEILNTLSSVGESRYERLLAIQHELAARVVYDHDKASDRIHEAAGALLDGRAVCDGYAKSFKILCDELGIPCVIVGGTATQPNSVEPHAWNLVQMENGLWYAVDVTWNDDEATLSSTDFFLVGANTVPSPGRLPFSQSHTPDGKFSAGEYTPFVFPTLSPEKYER